MKVIFNFLVLGAALLPAGCVNLEVDGTGDFSGEGIPAEVVTCEGCLSDQELRGELMLLVNTRLTNPGSNHTANFPIDGDGRFVGPALYLYDPTRTCDDGGSGCRLAPLGNLWLDDGLGSLSVGDGSLERFTVRDVAWDPSGGLWGLSYDALNDEWGLVDLEVPDWHSGENHVGVVRYTFLPGPVDDPSTDHCYWRQSLTGLGFVDGELFVGAAGKPGNGLDASGAVFSIPGDFLASPEHCVFANDRTQDPQYYACTPLCTTAASFGEWLGIAGDITESVDGQLLAMVGSEDAEAMPEDRNALFTVDVANSGEPVQTTVAIDDILAGRDIEGLARIGGVLYGVDPQGLVYAIVEPTAEAPTDWSVTVHDDLAPLFAAADESIRLRGATRVVVE
jgi:hypothetical protein